MSLNSGNSLKGFQFFDDEGNTQATYLFKDRILDIWKEISDERLEEIKAYINMEIIKIIRHY